MDTTLSDLSSFEKEMIESLSASTGHEGQCARNAINNLEKARLLAVLDPEMAVFRAITSEEEAAAALFYTLKRQNYKNSKKLDPHSHKQKNALYQYLLAINHFFAKQDYFSFKISCAVKKDGSKRIVYIRITLPDGKMIIPEPPLNLSISNTTAGGKVLFDDDFNEMVESFGKGDLPNYLKKLANQRNELLYASEQGIIKVDSNIEDIINAIKTHVFILLTGMCLIFPYKEKSIFIQQLINGFLLSIDVIKKDEILW